MAQTRFSQGALPEEQHDFMAPPGRHLFLFDELRPLEMVQAVVVGGASVLWFEVWKIFRRIAGASSGC